MHTLYLKKDKMTGFPFWVAKGQEGTFFCNICAIELTSGFYCELQHKMLCRDCQLKFNMKKCHELLPSKSNRNLEHEHKCFRSIEVMKDQYLDEFRDNDEQFIDLEEEEEDIDEVDLK